MNYPATTNFRQISILTMIREITVGIFLSNSGKTINSDLLLPKCWQNNLIIFPIIFNYALIIHQNLSKEGNLIHFYWFPCIVYSIVILYYYINLIY